MILVFDTETTGKANFYLPAADPSQPHPVQIGAILVDSNYEIRGEMNMIVKPSGWTIPESASSIHGITQEIAEQYGLPKCTVLNVFCELASKASIIVAHNLDFDYLVMQAFSIRCSDVVGRFTHLRDSGF